MWVRKLYGDRNFMMTTEIYGLRLAICCDDGGVGRGGCSNGVAEKMGRRENGGATIQQNFKVETSNLMKRTWS